VNFGGFLSSAARRVGVDPLAARAVAAVEGGIRGSVGDLGTSFGPWQLHWGGAMPRRFWGSRAASQAFANSPAGISYALRQMSGVARGLHGRAAVEAIVRGFERPADPAGEIARAMGHYGGQLAGGAMGALPAAPKIPSFNAAALPDIAGKLSFAPPKIPGLGTLPGLPGLPLIPGLGSFPTPYVAPPPTFNIVDKVRAAAGGLVHPIGAFANRAVRAAATQIGKPYQFGSGPSTASFDCSDLIQWSYKQMGINLPRTTFQQIHMGRAINPATQPLQPGDLVFPSPHHVVMYVGNGKVIAAPHTGTVVQYQRLSDFGRPYAVRRVL